MVNCFNWTLSEINVPDFIFVTLEPIFTFTIISFFERSFNKSVILISSSVKILVSYPLILLLSSLNW